jgi:methionyl aminopeptidase
VDSVRTTTLDIEYKTPEQLTKMRDAGLVVAATLARLADTVAPGVSTGELDALAEETIRAAGAVPSFKGYHDYPASICSSVNEQIVHAIPSPKQVLHEGDVISLDCGAIVDGWHGDAAVTVGVGPIDPKIDRMIGVAQDAMWAGIAAGARAVRTGRGRLTDISYAIETAIRKAGRYGIVRGYGGHGIGTAMHQDPHVLNYGRPGKGPRLVPGLALAIEPMLTMGSPDTVELADGWTVITRDRSIAVHVEHTVAFFADGVWVTTADDGGRDRLGDLVTSVAGVPSS